MKRRDFIAALGGATAASFVSPASAQQSMPVIGYLDPTIARRVRRHRAGVPPRSEGRGFRRGRERGDRVPLRGKSKCTAAGTGGRIGSPAGQRDRDVLKRCDSRPRRRPRPSRSCSISPKIRSGAVWSTSLSRPGGNLTGVNFVSAELVGKRLELLRELVPAANRVAVLVNPVIAQRADPRCTMRGRLPSAMGLQIQVVRRQHQRRDQSAPSHRWCASGLMRFSSRPTPSSRPGVSSWCIWRHATRSPRPMRGVNLSKPAG